MKAMTVIQPWAYLLASGKKQNETRSWRTNYRGEILIHAGKKDMTQAMRQTLFEARYMEKAGVFSMNMELGAIIGKAVLVDCFQIDEAYRYKLRRENEAELAFGDYRLGRYAWVMKDPVLFDEPIPAIGRQGLWNWEGTLK